MNTGINYYIKNITMVAAGFLAFGLILFSGDSVSNEYNPATLKFLLIQPISRIKVLLSKYFVMLISSLGLIMLTQFVFFLGVSLVKGIGGFARPILVDTKYEFITQNGNEVLRSIEGSGHYIELSSYLVRALLLQGLYIVVMVTFIFMVSTLVKSAIVSLTINISALLGATILYTLSTTYRQFSPFIFIHYSNIESIISGDVVAQTKNLLFTYQTIIIVSVITVLVFVGIALTVFKKRDIQI
ncbi:MAG: transporter permease [Anaerocolumna sp.]|nr:transporter permease [Anaerocolumna sp.]